MYNYRTHKYVDVQKHGISDDGTYDYRTHRYLDPSKAIDLAEQRASEERHPRRDSAMESMAREWADGLEVLAKNSSEITIVPNHPDALPGHTRIEFKLKK